MCGVKGVRGLTGKNSFSWAKLDVFRKNTPRKNALENRRWVCENAFTNPTSRQILNGVAKRLVICVECEMRSAFCKRWRKLKMLHVGKVCAKQFSLCGVPGQENWKLKTGSVVKELSYRRVRQAKNPGAAKSACKHSIILCEVGGAPRWCSGEGMSFQKPLGSKTQAA